MYKDFKASFPHLKQDSPSGQEASSTLAEAISESPLDLHTFRNLAEAHHDAVKEGEPTPKGHMDGWSFSTTGLTPSFLDPNSASFNSFANQMPGYYTPTPGGNSTLFHSHHAGDLHTPGFQYGIGTPLSMPTSEATMHAGQSALAVSSFSHAQQMNSGLSDAHQFQSLDPYQIHHQPFAAHSFPQQASSFQQMDSHSSESPSAGDAQMDLGMQQSPELVFHPDSFRRNASPTKFPHPLTEKFRYHVTLNAPTAMVKHEDEIPITYLNKGQTYTLNIVDTTPVHLAAGRSRYRTFVRVSFEDPDQRKKPSACWQLWKEGRGSNEAHHRGGKLQAVEFVDPAQASGSASDPRKARIDLEMASFDGFCVTWTPSMNNGLIDCPIPVRFNFLSTDFSHSKGVKGIPVRLCAKTELLMDSMSPSTNPTPAHEICYCKVKLFRDHGAERKLSNDVAHVKKSIEKVNQQIAQMEAGMRDLGKRKRSSAGQESQRPGKIPKHRRTWSMSSAQSPEKTTAEDELHMKLAILQEMFSSTRPSSNFFLRGASEDDADLYPVRLDGEPTDLTKTETQDSAAWERVSAQSSSGISPTPSHRSVLSTTRQDSGFQQIPQIKTTKSVESQDWKRPNAQTAQDLPASQQHLKTLAASGDGQVVNPQDLTSPTIQPMKIPTSSPTSGTLSGWIESLGVDPSYDPPERAIKPAACFHFQPRMAGVKAEDHYYRAVYLMRRTLKDLVTAICMKLSMEPTKILRVIRVNKQGLQVLLDDQDVAQMAEGQAMVAEFVPLEGFTSSRSSGQQWNSNTTVQVDGDLSSLRETPSSGLELKLYF